MSQQQILEDAGRLSAGNVSTSSSSQLARKLRDSGMVQEDIARKVGVNQSTVSRWLGKRHHALKNMGEKKSFLHLAACAILLSIAYGGHVAARHLVSHGGSERTAHRVLHALVDTGFFKRSTVYGHYVLTDAASNTFQGIVQQHSIRYLLFDVLQFDKLEESAMDEKLKKIKTMWNIRHGRTAESCAIGSYATLAIRARRFVGSLPDPWVVPSRGRSLKNDPRALVTCLLFKQHLKMSFRKTATFFRDNKELWGTIKLDKAPSYVELFCASKNLTEEYRKQIAQFTGE